VDLFSQGFALCYCILPLRGLNSPQPLSFEKEKGDMCTFFSNCSPSLIQLGFGEKVQVVESKILEGKFF